MASMIFVCHPINGQVRTTFLRTIDPYYKRKGYKWLIMATVITSIVLWNYYPFNCYVTCSLFLRFWYLILELFRQLGIVFHFMYLHLLELFRQLGIVFHFMYQHFVFFTGTLSIKICYFVNLFSWLVLYLYQVRQDTEIFEVCYKSLVKGGKTA
jgi:hypothetical protein